MEVSDIHSPIPTKHPPKTYLYSDRSSTDPKRLNPPITKNLFASFVFYKCPLGPIGLPHWDGRDSWSHAAPIHPIINLATGLNPTLSLNLIPILTLTLNSGTTSTSPHTMATSLHFKVTPVPISQTTRTKLPGGSDSPI